MSTLAGLSSQLSLLVTASGNTPSADQYEQVVKNAVADLGHRIPRRLTTTLAITAGTAVYDLPAGFIKVIRFDPIAGGTMRYDSQGLLVPFERGFGEILVWDSGQLTIDPTPGYSLNRTLIYAAGYSLDEETGVFAGLTAALEGLVMLKAQAGTLRVLGNTAAGAGSYQIGDTRVDKGRGATSYATAAKDFDDQYLAAVRAFNGPGLRVSVRDRRGL